MKTTAWIYTVGIIVLAIVFSFRSAGAQHDEMHEFRDLLGFDAITVGGGFDVKIRQGDEFVVEVITSDDSFDHVHTEVRDSTLDIHRARGGKFFGLFPADADVAVTLPVLTSATARGASDIETVGSISGDSLRIAASGGADVDMDVQVTTLEVITSGGADVDLSGTAESVSVKASGGSDLFARSLTARDVQLQTSGGSDVDVAVTERISGSVSGGSDVNYSGQPAVVDVKVSGGGDLSNR